MASRSTGQGDEGADPGPGERHWFHPSELPTDPFRRASRASPGHRSRLAVPLTAALAGALAAFGITALAMGSSSSKSRSSVTTSPVAFAADAPEPVATVTETAGPGVVSVAAWAGALVRYGSGVVYRTDGLVVTAASLVADAGAIEVRAPDGRHAAAVVVGTDPDNDLALLRTELPDLAALEFPSRQPPTKVGDGCVLLGSGGPDQEGHWAARGTIASTGKVVAVDDHWMVDVLEVDADLDATAVGGALLDPSGRVLGVLTDVGQGRVSGTLVVPAAAVRRSVEQLLTRGRVDHPWLGLATTDVVEPVQGALVHVVDPDGPAAGAGLAPGDIVVHLGGREIRGRAGLLRQVRRQEVGDVVVLGIFRNGRQVEVTVIMGTRPT